MLGSEQSYADHWSSVLAVFDCLGEDGHVVRGCDNGYPYTASCKEPCDVKDRKHVALGHEWEQNYMELLRFIPHIDI